MKILFYINTLGRGGAQRVLVNLASKFAEEKFEVVLVTSFPVLDEYKYFPLVKRLLLEDKPTKSNVIIRNIMRTLKLRKIVTTEKPDLVISFMAEPNIRALIATRFISTKVIVSVRNDPNKEYGSALRKILVRCLFRFANGLVFQTEEAQEWFSKAIKKKSRIIMNQVDEKFFNTERRNRDYFVAIGRLTTQKNQELLIRSFAKFCKKHPTELLRIYGEGELKARFSDLIVELNMQDNIKLMGTTDHVHDVLANAKAFILTSDYEGMPNALLEAMAMGLPCFSTDCPCGGPRTIIIHGENGFLFPVKDEEQLVILLNDYYKNKNPYEIIGVKAKISANEFKPEIVFKRWASFCQEVFIQGKDIRKGSFRDK